MRMELFYSVFGKLSHFIFFVWLNSRIGRSRSVFIWLDNYISVEAREEIVLTEQRHHNHFT